MLGEYFPILVWVSSEEKIQLFLIPAFLLETGWAVIQAQASGMVVRCGILFHVRILAVREWSSRNLDVTEGSFFKNGSLEFGQ